MPFGRYKGLPVEELPGGYLRWLSSLPHLRNPLLKAVQAEVDRRADEEAEAEPTYRSGDACPNPELADELIGAGVRSLAKIFHPDLAGGSNEQMRDVNLTAEWLRRQARGIEC